MKWKMPVAEKIEKRRLEVLSAIATEQLYVELIVSRPRNSEDDPIDDARRQRIVIELAAIEDKARKATSIEALNDLQDDAELWGAFRGYLCPRQEISLEGELALDVMAEWGVPKLAIKKLRDALKKGISESPAQARLVLHKIFEEQDSWSEYTDDYEETMSKYAWRLFLPSVGLPVLAVLAFHFGYKWPGFVVFGLLGSGIAGSCISVLRKMPALEVSLSKELDAYARRILSRIGFGIATTMVGSALLGWGLLPMGIQGQTFTSALTACSTSCSNTSLSACEVTKSLLLLGIGMLLGFSERGLSWIEQAVFRNLGKSRTARSTAGDDE
jgi:hypothetical protein